MKKICCITLCLALLLTAPAALANSWGLSGGALLTAVSAVHTWDDYTALSQAGDAAVMSSRYHNALMTAEDGTLRVYTTAVYQPGDARANQAKLRQEGGALILTYGEDERYAFVRAAEGMPYALSEARVGAFSVRATEQRYDAEFQAYYGAWYEAADGAQTAQFFRTLTLDSFRVTLFPRSVEEVRALNKIQAKLESGERCLGWWEREEKGSSHVTAAGDALEPVYSAPFGDSAWRAANGKAAVALGGELWVLGAGVVNSAGEGYFCIRYDVSQRTQRIGYVRAAALQGALSYGPSEMAMDEMIHVDVRAVRETYLTDDPDVSQFSQFTVPAGTRFSCMGTYDGDYAYVSAEVRDGRFTDGGAIVWGFVPLRDLEVDLSDVEIQTDIMRQLEGGWYYAAGGGMASERLILHADGTFEAVDPQGDDMPPVVEKGAWYVTRYNPFQNLYWGGDYEMTLLYADGTVNIKGLMLEEDAFSLINWEGSGGYCRWPEENGDIYQYGGANG